MMTGSLKVSGLGKRFARHRDDRPRTLKEWLTRGWRSGRAPAGYFWALREVAFEIGSGEMLGVIGHNGSGKSTLLRLLGGVMKPEEGEVTATGRVHGLLELNTGMHPDLSGRENIYINGIVAGLTRDQVEQRFDDIVAFAELEDFIDSPVRTYSSGMKMRLGFAVSVHVDPGVLLIDEVLSVGDLAFQQKCLDRIRLFKEQGCAIVLITHDLSQVEQLCDRALWLRRGEVVAYGEPAVLVGEYKAEMSSETRRRTPVDIPGRVTAAGVTLTPNENRFGSLEAEIDDVRLLDARGNPVQSIEAGASLTVEVSFSAAKLADPPLLSVSIGSDAHENYVDLNTDSDKVPLPLADAPRTVRLHLDRLDLQPGDYFVNVGLYERSWAYAYDYHWRAYPLGITSEHSGSGLLNPPRRWESDSAELPARRAGTVPLS
jgi:lipopolysaccharide transport system ATP-binding protein